MSATGLFLSTAGKEVEHLLYVTRVVYFEVTQSLYLLSVNKIEACGLYIFNEEHKMI